MSARARTISSAEMTAHAGYTPESELHWTKAAKRLQAAAKGSALAGFLPKEGGIPWIPSVPLDQDYYGIDRSQGPVDEFRYRVQAKTPEWGPTSPGYNGKVRL